MLFPLLIFFTAVIIFLYLYRNISLNKITETNSFQTKIENLKQKYEFMRGRKRELERELKDKKRQLATLRNNQEGIRTISADDLDVEEIDENEKVSRFLIQEGKITLEQNEKVLKKMEVLQLDYIGVCMTLGYIDIETAKRVIKINKIASKSIQ